MIEKVDIIIPTWNSMPEFYKTLQSLKRAFPQGIVDNVFVVDRGSNDGTVEIAEHFGCKVITDSVSLGSARLRGLQKCKSKWICFIDSDIELPLNWFGLMMDQYKGFPVPEKIGWFFGRTVDSREKIKRIQMWEANHKDGLYGGFKNGWNQVGLGRRGFTNNTFCLREPLLKASQTNIRDVSGHEDWVLSQVMLREGYSILEVPVFCNHLRDHTFGKWGRYSEAWNIYGQFKAGLHPRVGNYLWIPKKGLEFSLRFRNPWYLWYHIGQFWGCIKAIYNPVEKDRGKI